MGSLSKMRAGNRVRSAIIQRLEAAASSEERGAVFNEAVDCLIRIATDSEDLNSAAVELSREPEHLTPSLPEKEVERLNERL